MATSDVFMAVTDLNKSPMMWVLYVKRFWLLSVIPNNKIMSVIAIQLISLNFEKHTSVMYV